MIRVFAVGDVMGKAGRNCLAKSLPRVRERYQPDFVLINGENAAGGFGLSKKIFEFFTQELQIDCITMGNHWHENREIYQFIETTDRIVLPANMANISAESVGLRLFKTKGGAELAVINLIGKAFMHADNRNPFLAAQNLMAQIPERIKIRIVDMHAEATSEKHGMAQFLRGTASLVYGTHSHVPTADERLLGTTGYVTDLGMTGAYDSIIGMRTAGVLKRLVHGEKSEMRPAEEDPWLWGIIADIDEQSGACTHIERVKWQLNQMDL